LANASPIGGLVNGRTSNPKRTRQQFRQILSWLIAQQSSTRKS
jgi:hypothetical protein